MTYADLKMFERSYSSYKGRNVAIKNCVQGVRIIQNVTASITDVINSLQEMRALAVNNASGSLSDQDITNNNDAFKTVLNRIDVIVSNTQYNGKNLIDANPSTAAFESVTIQTGHENSSDDKITLEFRSLKVGENGGNLNNTNTGNTNFVFNTVDLSAMISTQSDAEAAIDELDHMIDEATEEVAKVESNKDRLILCAENLRKLNIVEVKNMIHLRDISDEVRTHVNKLDRLQTSTYEPIEWDYATRKINYHP